MKDSRVGSYGVLALILVIAARIMALAALPPHFKAYIIDQPGDGEPHDDGGLSELATLCPR